MRKTSTYARKKARGCNDTIVYKFGQYGVIRAVPKIQGMDAVMARCLPYRDNPVFDSTKFLLQLREALDAFLTHTVHDIETFNLLSVCLNEGKVRTLEIGGEGNPAFVIVERGIQAINRTAERWQRTGKWGLDGPARQDLIDAVSMYEEVFLESTPAQMHDAAMTAFRWIEIQQSTNCHTKPI
jgi:hypothetical protein